MAIKIGNNNFQYKKIELFVRLRMAQRYSNKKLKKEKMELGIKVFAQYPLDSPIIKLFLKAGFAANKIEF